MGNVTIGDLPAVSSVGGSDLFETEQSGAAKKATGTQIQTFVHSVLTTRGDLLRRGASAAERVALGAAGKVLRSDGTDPGWDDAIKSGTEQASSSGSAINFTSIPAWVKRITVQLVGVSTNGTSPICVQIGTSSGLETSGYVTTGGQVTSGGVGTVQQTNSFPCQNESSAGTILTGTLTLTLQDASDNTWLAVFVGFGEGNGAMFFGMGRKALAAVLDRLTVTTAGGTDAFDAGVINITYE